MPETARRYCFKQTADENKEKKGRRSGGGGGGNSITKAANSGVQGSRAERVEPTTGTKECDIHQPSIQSDTIQKARERSG